MSRWPLQLSRRKFLRSTALGATAVAGLLHAPAIPRAQGAAVKIGVLHPVSGALSYSGQQGRLGATTVSRCCGWIVITCMKAHFMHSTSLPNDARRSPNRG